MSHIFLVVLSLLLMVCCANATPDLTLYVSPKGSDNNAGSRSKPFATIEAARDAIRAAKAKSALSNGVEVIIAGGHYHLKDTLTFNSQDSGVPGGPILYRSRKGAEVALCGSRAIPYSACKPVQDKAVMKRVGPAVARRLLCVDLNALGFKPLHRLGKEFRMPFAIPELFIDGRRQGLACWPSKGWTTISKIIDQGDRSSTGHAEDSADPNKKRKKAIRGGTFAYRGNRPARWKVEKGLWLHGFWCYDWYDSVQQVKSIDTQKKQITLMVPHTYGLRRGNPSPRRWRAINLLEELDTPGEYYIDTDTNRLYFLPDKKLSPKSRITLAERNAPVISCKGVQHLTLKGLAVEESFHNGLSLSDCSSVTIQDCTIRNIRMTGLSCSNGRSNRVARCVVHDTGTGGISMGGGNRKTLEPAGNVIENCHVCDFAIHQLTYANAISLSGVGNTAAHNLLENAPHMAVGISGNNHVFEYNIVRNVCLASDDAGALYKGRNPSCRGNVIRYNYWTNIGCPRGHGTAAIYFDDGDGGEVVYGNIFYRAGDPGKTHFGTVFSHGGHDNLAENNIFIECKRALGSGPWNFKRWSNYIKAPLWQTRLLKDVDITSEVYLKHYPSLKGFMNPKPEDKRVNYARRNVFVQCGSVSIKAWEVDDTNWTTDGDPGFVNYKKGDFRLRKNSAIFKHIPDFKPIPFEKIGPQK